jgi:hypothetical protein
MALRESEAASAQTETIKKIFPLGKKESHGNQKGISL